MAEDHLERFDRVELLLQQFDARMDQGEPGDQEVLDEIRYHLDWIQAVAGELSFDWLWAHYLSAHWHRCRARLLRDLDELDAAIAVLRMVIGHSDTFFFRFDLVEILQIRYGSTRADDRPYLAEIVSELRHLVAREPDEEQDRAKAMSILGQALREQFRRELDAGEGPAPELLDEAEDLLDGSLDLFDADAGFLRSEATLELARLRSFRARTSFAAYARDPEAESEEAIVLYESVAHEDPMAAYELAEMWSGRLGDSDDPLARSEALRLLNTIEHAPQIQDRVTEYAERRGELLLARAREDRAELPALIGYLVGAFAAEPVQGLIGLTLMNAYWLAGDAEGVIRVADRLSAATDGEDIPPRELIMPHLAVATASLALRGRADLDEAERLLRETVDGPYEPGWASELPVALLAVVTDRGSNLPDSLAVFVLCDGDEKQMATELLEWLRRHERPGTDWLRAVASLTHYLADDPASRLTALAAMSAAHAALGESASPDLVAKHGMLLASCGEDQDDRGMMVKAMVVLEEFFGRAAADHPLWTMMLGLHGMMLANVHARGGGAGLPLRNAVAALEKASTDTAITPQHRSVFLVQLAGAQLLQIVGDRVDLYGSAIGHCRQAMSLVRPGTDEHDRAWLLLGSILVTRFSDHGERHDRDAGQRHLLDLRASRLARGLDVADVDDTMRELESHLTTGVPVDLGLTASEAYTRLSELESSGMDPAAATTERVMLMQVLLHHAEETGNIAMAADAVDQLGRAADTVEQGSVMHFTTSLLALIGPMHAAAVRGDSEKFADGVARLEAIRDATDDGNRVAVVFALMTLWHSRYTVSRRTADLDEALRHYAVLDTTSPRLGEIVDTLDDLADSCWSLRALGYGTAAAEIGFDCLRYRAYRVLLQTTGQHAALDAVDAAARGQRVALRSAESGELGAAVEAVEWGRGLVLHGAMFTSGIASRLRAAGHSALAEEWEGEPAAQVTAGREMDFAPSDVRRRVLAVLRNDQKTLAPPSSEEIAGALRGLDATALVHLVPGLGKQAGRAFVTTAGGAVFEVLLPLLVDGPDTAVGRYLVMNDEQRRAVLPALCAWAWRAMEPLLDRLSGGWLVLVPTGALGVVPWHAAAGAGRTALLEVGFTYAASARQLCELARRERQPVGASPVVVSNPAGTLMAAQYEAEFLHGLYPHGHFYGQAGPGVPVRGAGTPDEVLEERGASLQHLGCHARAGATPAQSALELARADLSVERMLRHAAMRRDDVPGGLVVLAACESDLTAGLHDEVLTLAAAYVAAGATGVVGTKWKVDDVESALLMCVFYDFLARRGMRPRDALRAVQLWALDPDRVVPSRVARHLAERGRSASLAKPVYWAAFAHHGW